jgi:deoxyribonuclease-2
VASNDISGFWMVHSVPKFPPALGESYDYPHTGTIYGQSFLCISFTAEQIDYVGKQLMYNEPHFYSSHVPEYLKP